jgi:spermidine synthase
MNPLKKINPVLEFDEIDRAQGVERTYLYYNNLSYHFNTEKQDVNIIQSPYWGKMLFLDGTLQSTTRDEIMYHNALVHPLMDVLQNKKNILILGGGEGATAREVLRWDVNKVTMVDYDKELVSFMINKENSWSQGALYDQRLKLIYDDAWAYMESIVKNGTTYDGVIVDLTDPDLKKEKWLPLFEMIIKTINGEGGFVMNAGLYVPWDITQLKEIKELIEGLCIKNPGLKYYIYTLYIPSFNGEWTFIVVANKRRFMLDPSLLQVIPSWIRRGIKQLENKHIEISACTIPCINTIFSKI